MLLGLTGWVLWCFNEGHELHRPNPDRSLVLNGLFGLGDRMSLSGGCDSSLGGLGRGQTLVLRPLSEIQPEIGKTGP
jgi:hypothetical protein